MPSLLLAALLSLPNVPAADLSTRFAEAVETDTIAAVRQLVGLQTDLGTPSWRSLRELIETNDCISVSSHHVEVDVHDEDSVVLRVFLAGTAVTTGSPRRPVTLPPVWLIESVRSEEGWQIRSVATAEQHLATEIVSQARSSDRWALVADTHADLSAVAREIAEQATDGPEPAAEGAIHFAVALSRDIGNALAEATCLRLLSTHNLIVHNPPAALEAAKLSLAGAEQSGSADAVAGALFAIGIAEWIGDDPLAGVQYLDRAGSMADEIEDPRTAIKALYMASYVLAGQRNLSAALSRTLRCEVLSRKYGWQNGELDALFSIANLHKQLKNIELFAELSRRTHDRAMELGDRGKAALALCNVADAQSGMEQFDDVIATLRKVFESEHTALGGGLGAHAYGLLGTCLLAQQRFDEASMALEESLEISQRMDDQRRVQLTMAQLSELQYAQGRFGEALSIAREAVAITGQGVTRNTAELEPWTAKVAEARALARLCRDEEATLGFREAISMIEQWRQSVSSSETTRARAFGGNIHPYLGLIDLLVEQGATQDALDLSERFKGRVLQDVIEAGRIDLDSLMSEQEKERERALTREIADLNRTRLQAEGAARVRLEERLRLAKHELETFSEAIYLTRARVPVLTEHAPRRLTAASVPENTLILDYVVTEESLVLFAIVRDGPELKVHVRRLPIRRKELNVRVRRLVEAIGRRSLRWRSEANGLYDLLLKPIEPLLSSRRTICIVPDDVLWEVPFHALAAARGPFLLESSAVFYAPSLTFLHETRQLARPAGRRDRTLLALGTAAREGLGPLPDAEEEVRAIGKLYERATVYVGAAARESKVKKEASQYDVLHFATHGLIDDRSPMFSSLVLTADATDDGLLEARELVKLDLRADLAILSACDTGGGTMYPGEGVVGLSWSFLLAGCPTTVVSRWKVDSRSTAVIMIALHRHLTALGLSTAEALRRAEIALMRDPEYAHPYYWASFHVVGAGW